jgi:hypothetical protein
MEQGPGDVAEILDQNPVGTTRDEGRETVDIARVEEGETVDRAHVEKTDRNDIFQGEEREYADTGGQMMGESVHMARHMDVGPDDVVEPTEPKPAHIAG